LTSTKWKRTYWAVFAANTITAVGMMSFLPFFPSLMEEVGVEDRAAVAAWSGVIFGAAPLTAAIMGPIWGSIGDRYGRKVMVLRAMLAITVFVGAMGLAQTPWQLLALRVGQGFFAGFIPPSITLVSVQAPKGMPQGRITGNLQAALAAGSILGPPLGALVGGVLGLRAVFLFVAIASAMAAGLVALFAHEDKTMRATLETWSPGSMLTEVVRDLRDFLAQPRMRAGVILLFCLQFGVGSTSPLMEIYVGDIVDGDPDHVRKLTAGLFTALAAAVLAGSPLWGRYGDRVGHRRALVQATILAAVVLAGHAATTFFLALLAARILIGFCAGGSNATAFGLAATEISPDRRGAALGAVFSARALAVSLGAMSGGALASVLGIPGLFLASGGLVLVAVLATRPWR